MATEYDVKFLAAAKAILDKFGIAATLKTKTAGGYDPTTGEVTSTENSVSVSKMSPPLRFQNHEIDNSLVLSTDVKFIVSGDVGNLSNVDEVSVNGVNYILAQANPIYSGTEIAIWILQCRRGAPDTISVV